MKIVLIQRIFSNYRKPIFDRLSEKYDITLLHAKNKSGIKQIHTEYSKTISMFSYYKKETTVYLSVILNLLRIKPNVVIHEFNPSIISLYPLFLLKYLLGFKLILWGHGFNKDDRNRKSISAKLRITLAECADAIIFYSEGGKGSMLPFINNSEKLFVAYNTLDTEYLLVLNEKFKKEGKSNLKTKLNFFHNYNIIFIGRLLHEKVLPEIFVSIVLRISKLRDDIGIHFIGDGECELLLKSSLSKQNNVFFHGALHDDYKTGELLFVSDLLLNPGYLGLSVNHALAFGTPVFSFREGENGPFHSPEAEYILHGSNGYLASPFDVSEMVIAINDFLNDSSQQQLFSQNSIRAIREKASIKNMEHGFINAIKYATKH